jgi:capsular exopolysaccharide synthesis family protein
MRSAVAVADLSKDAPPQRERNVGEDGYTFSPNLVTLAAPLSTGAEALRALRTHILAQHIHAGRRALAICAPSVNVGCSFVAVNLAVALAQIGIKTLLIDGDLRTPSVEKFITPATPARGLAACLAEPGSRVGDFIDEEPLPNLSVLFAGGPAHNAQELLARDWFADVMHLCLREYEITIIDTPPANTCADARRISDVAGYSMIVARRNKSLVADIKTLVEQLKDDDVTVIGALMNAD